VSEFQIQVNSLAEQLRSKDTFLATTRDQIRQITELEQLIWRYTQKEHLSDSYIENQIRGAILRGKPLELNAHGLEQADIENYIERVLLYLRDIKYSGMITFITGYNRGVTLRDEIERYFKDRNIYYTIPEYNRGIIEARV
jgi:hypothetical protein